MKVRVKQKVALVVSGVCLAIGLVVGLTPQTVDTFSTSNVDCGSPFFPVADPAGASSTDVWGDVLGYEPNDFFASDRRLAGSICETYLSNDRTAGLVFGGLGLAGILATWIGIRRARPEEHAEPPATAPTATPTDRETFWRAQGYAPPEEAGPPEGWVRTGDPQP